MNSKHLGKCQFALKLIQFSIVSNLFPLEVVQKCQCCHCRKTRLGECVCNWWLKELSYRLLFFAKTFGDFNLHEVK